MAKKKKPKSKRKPKENTLAQDIGALLLARRWADMELENAIMREKQWPS